MTDAAAPSLTMLIKLLKMTTSSHDNEALVAVRKANAELAKFGGDWDSLLRGKVTVIGDPFADLAQPDDRSRRGFGAPRAPSPPQQAYSPPPAATPSAPPPRQHFTPRPTGPRHAQASGHYSTMGSSTGGPQGGWTPPPGAAPNTLKQKLKRPSKNGALDIGDLI